MFHVKPSGNVPRETNYIDKNIEKMGIKTQKNFSNFSHNQRKKSNILLIFLKKPAKNLDLYPYLGYIEKEAFRIGILNSINFWLTDVRFR